MSSLTLTDKQLDSLLAKFDIEQIQSAIRVINSIEENIPEADVSPWAALKAEEQAKGNLPKDDKKGHVPYNVTALTSNI